MKVPEYIESALRRRARAAEQWNHNDLIISEFIDKNGIVVESHDYHGGVEAIVNPYDSVSRIKRAIENK